MADSPVGSLPAVSTVYDADYFVLEQDGLAKKMSGAQLMAYVDRDILSVSCYELPAGSNATVSYNRLTGNLTIGLPKANGITSVTQNPNTYQLTFTWEDGTQVNVGTVKGETGKSAYDYAVENGYTGTESSYADLMVDLYNAAQNEAVRVQNEQQRQTDYQYILDSTQEQLDKFSDLMEQADAVVVNTTLFLYRGGVGVQSTTLFL